MTYKVDRHIMGNPLRLVVRFRAWVEPIRAGEEVESKVTLPNWVSAPKNAQASTDWGGKVVKPSTQVGPSTPNGIFPR